MTETAETPGLSVVIPTRDGAARLGPTLESIAAQEVDAVVEVVVVDDGSTDGSARLASATRLPWGRPVAIRHERGRGRAAACNAGLRAASAPVVVILDDDMTLRPGALQAHRSFHRDRTRAAALGRIELAPRDRDTCFLRFLAREQRVREDALRRSARQVPFALCLTGQFSAERATLLEIDGFDERITRYGFEDIELGFRLTRAGVGLAYLPGAVSIHRAYMTDLDRYLDRHFESGIVARELAERYPSGAFREYLRVEGPSRLGVGNDRPGLVLLRLGNRLLLRRPVRRALGSRVGFSALRTALAAAAALGLDRFVHLGYHLARDLRYFQGYFGERDAGTAA